MLFDVLLWPTHYRSTYLCVLQELDKKDFMQKILLFVKKNIKITFIRKLLVSQILFLILAILPFWEYGNVHCCSQVLCSFNFC